MKQQSVAVEENITRKLYDDYSRFKKLLFENITQQNPAYDRLILFKKTQKLLDRFLFILFAEDRGLLPPNSVRDILSQWDQLKDLDNYVPLYARFQKYFGYLNTGHKGKQHEIFAYNGGLFMPDEILDNITIDDALLYESCKGLSNYDFESEVDVNILGHIFEHSLNEIEEIEQQLSNGEAIENKTSKRKKDGVFYTPRYITKYIVENTLGALCIQKRNELHIIDEDFVPQKRKANKKHLSEKLEDYRDWLLDLTICDPACGSGAFLNQALEFLIAEHQSIDILKAKLFGDALVFSDVENSILENNLYGVDINEEATDIAKLSLWLRTARKGRKLNNLSQHIKCGNSLIDDPTVAGAKAFNWEKEFPEVFGDKRKLFFAIVNDYKEKVANYKTTPEQLDAIFQKMDKKGFAQIEMEWGAPLTSVSDFVEAVLTLLHDERPPMMWMLLMTDDDETVAVLKELSENNGIPLEDVHEVIMEKFLEDVEVNFDDYSDGFSSGFIRGFDVVIGNPPYVTGDSLDYSKNFIRTKYKTAQYQLDLYVLFIEKSLSLISEKGLISFITPNSWLKNMMMSECRKFLLDNVYLLKITPNLPNVFEDASVDSSIFVFSKDKSAYTGTEVFYYRNKDFELKHIVQQENFRKNEKFIFSVEISSGLQYIIDKMRIDTVEVGNVFDVTRGINPYDIYTGQSKEVIQSKAYHADSPKDSTFVPELRGKDVSRYNYIWNGSDYISYGDWLAAPRNPKYFTGKRIMFREILGKNFVCTYIDEDFKIDRSLYIAKHENENYDCKYALTILASKLMAFYFRYVNNEFDTLFPKIRVAEFKKLPIKIISPEQQLSFIAKADIMLSKSKELQLVKQSLLQLLHSKYEGITFSKKLQDWPALSFNEFLKELVKQKIKLLLPAQAEWMPYFETEKAKANAIQQIIYQTDKEIDDMVYQLYGLTEEERKVVEEG
jgi:type I restriction-modification system DNA methylase subunit